MGSSTNDSMGRIESTTVPDHGNKFERTGIFVELDSENGILQVLARKYPHG